MCEHANITWHPNFKNMITVKIAQNTNAISEVKQRRNQLDSLFMITFIR